MKKLLPIAALAALALLALYGYQSWRDPSVVGLLTYTNPAYGVEFQYPKNYALSEPFESEGVDADPQTQDPPLFMITLVRKNDFKAMQSADAPGEGPPAVTFQVYKNPNSLPLEQWIQENPASNFRLGDQQMLTGTLDSVEAKSYSWSGLYEGKSVAVAQGSTIYLFSVYTMSPTDAIARVFEQILFSLNFAENPDAEK